MNAQSRLQTITEILNDPVVNVSGKEAVSLAYHAIRYELLNAYERRIHNRKACSGAKIRDFIDIANFRKEMEDL